MSSINMRMHVNDNGVYKILHPETSSDQVLLPDSSTLKNHLESFVPIKIIDDEVKFLNPITNEYETYSSDTFASLALTKITNLSHSLTSNKAIIKWNDPSDITINTSTKTVTIAKWKGTKLIMKEGAIPSNENDGTLIVDSVIRDQYATSGFEVSNLVYGSTYYIKAFPYTESGVVTNSNDSIVQFLVQLPVPNNVSGVSFINAGVEAYLLWKDPSDDVWAGTKILMKEGNKVPTSIDDGTLLVDNKVRDKYSTSSTALKIPDMKASTAYGVAFFTYSAEGAVRVGTSISIKRTPAALPSATAYSVTSNQGVASINWSDPVNKTQSILGTVFTTAIWKESKLVRKIGSYATSVTDGTLVTTSTQRDKYKTTAFKDSGLSNGTNYYYTLFSTSTDDMTTVTNLGSVNIVVDDDASGSPGPANLTAGTKSAGYYGLVPATNLITGQMLSQQIGLTSGSSVNNDQGWLKFSIDGKTIFVAKKAFRYDLSWDHINATGSALGTRNITISGLTYKVRLIRGARNNPADHNTLETNDRDAIGSEWNRLMLPIHIGAMNNSWAYPQYVESYVPDWGVRFTNQDLGVDLNYDFGAYTWCQETIYQSVASRVFRGGPEITLPSYNMDSSNATVNCGWRPVLELVQ